MISTLSTIRPLASTPAMRVAASFLFIASNCLWLTNLVVAQIPAQNQPPIIADRVLVVVNQQVILQSDLNREMRLSILDPNLDFSHRPLPADAIERLISRALIHQQFAGQPHLTPTELQQAVNQRLTDLRAELPACIQLECGKPEGWQAFLSQTNLTQADVEAFIREQIQILDLIEKRFRAGIHITPDQIADYYQSTLLPQYAQPSQAPTLDSVSERINEILLEQQVNLILDDWLTTLRKEGDVEFLDSSLIVDSSHPDSASPHTNAPAHPETSPLLSNGRLHP